MNKINTLIVDDEPLARLNIREALKNHSNWHVLAELSGAKELYEVLEETKPDVVFLDIHMPGEKGTSIAKKILTQTHKPFIIFITAYDDYALEAFELMALDYILKPFDDERFQTTLQKTEYLLNHHADLNSLLNHQQQALNHQSLEKIIIKSVGSIKIIDCQDVDSFTSAGNYAQVNHRGGQDLYRVQMSFLEKHLSEEMFCRVHRSAIVKLSAIEEFKTLDDNKYKVLLSNGQSINVSSTYKEQLLARLGIEK